MRAVWRWLSPNELDRGASRSCAPLAPLRFHVNDPPVFDENLCLERGLELLTVQELAANVHVERLDPGVLPRIPRSMKTVSVPWHRHTTAWAMN